MNYVYVNMNYVNYVSNVFLLTEKVLFKF